MKPIRCILGFHKEKLIKAFLEKGDLVFGRPSNYVALRVTQCKICEWYKFEYAKIIHDKLFYGSYWQSTLAGKDKEHIYDKTDKPNVPQSLYRKCKDCLEYRVDRNDSGEITGHHCNTYPNCWT